jgi:tetratricopeptide (TPR) repeat protein
MTRLVTLVVAAVLVGGVPTHAQLLARFTNPQVEVTMTHPPGFPLTLERAAVLARGEECAEEFTDAVIEIFTREGVELLDRQNIETVLAEQDLAASSYVDVDTAVELGKILGSAALILINTQRCDEVQNRSHESFRTLDGKQGTKYVAKMEGFYKGSVRVVDLATARIFAAQTVDGRSVLENTSYDGYPEYPSRYDARDAALRQGVTQVHRMFFAWDERRQLYFFNDDECNLRAAFKLLQIDDVEGAAEVSAENLEVCKTADVKPKFFARAYYNLGMARLLQSRYDEALGHLEQAYRLDGGSIIAESISETRRAKDLAAAMARVEDSAAVGPAVAQTSPEPAASGGDGSVAARLQQLDSLLAQGLISDDEYEQKRKEILSEI